MCTKVLFSERNDHFALHKLRSKVFVHIFVILAENDLKCTIFHFKPTLKLHNSAYIFDPDLFFYHFGSNKKKIGVLQGTPGSGSRYWYWVFSIYSVLVLSPCICMRIAGSGTLPGLLRLKKKKMQFFFRQLYKVQLALYSCRKTSSQSVRDFT